MKKLKKSFLFAILILVVSAMFLLQGCKANKPVQSIVGKWELSEELSTRGIAIPSTLEFFSDGSVQSDWGGKYTIDGSKLNIYYAAMDSYSYDFSLKGDMLTLSIDYDESYNDEGEYVYYRSGSTAQEEHRKEIEEMEQAQSRLSDECNDIIAQGTDINGDFYELVATQEDTYNSTVIKLGVIKNNEWLVELSTENPFLDKETGLLWYYDHLGFDEYSYTTTGLENRRNLYSFIGNGCFYHQGTFYNVNTNKYYKDDFVITDEMYCYPNKYFMAYEFYDFDESEIPPVKECENIILEIKNAEPKKYQLLNTTTMTVTAMGKADKYRIEAPFSEDLFLGNDNEKYKYAFYNRNGDKVIDLSEYNISYINESETEGIFIDGKATFCVYNDVGKQFRLTIDKDGNVLSQEEVVKN